MSYTLQAFIADEPVIRAAVPADANTVRLPQCKAMIPLSARMREAHGLPFLPLTDEGASALPDGITAIGAAIARGGKVAYVEAEFFGGDGTQACVTWDSARQVSQPLVDDRAINIALRFLGVMVGDHHDEFDALGLGRYRGTDEWLQTAEPVAPPNGGAAECWGTSGPSEVPPSVS